MATVAGAMVARARREVKQLFYEKEAFSPDRAVEYEPRMPIQRRYLNQLIAEGVIHETTPGRYWLDRAVEEELRRKQAVWTMRIMALAAVVVVVVWAIRAAMR